MANQELLLFGKWSYEDLECSDATLTVSYDVPGSTVVATPGRQQLMGSSNTSTTAAHAA